MGQALDSGEAQLAARFEAVVGEIFNFRPREPHHHPNLFGGEASISYERILVGVARGREALDLAIGEGLSALADGDKLMDHHTSLCAVHHLRGIHRGLLRVWGTAPDHLVWEMGAPPAGAAPAAMMAVNRSRPAVGLAC